MSRASIVGMLVAAEVVIVGIAVFAMRGTVSGAQPANFTARSIAAIAAGAAPRVAVDDPQSRVVFGTSSDGLVHVRDLTNVHGWFFGSPRHIAQLDVKRTADGVSVVRPDAGPANAVVPFSFDFMSEHSIEIDAPPGAHVDIARCAGANVSGMLGGVAVRSQDGRVTLTDVQGPVDARSDDGSLSATRVRGNSLALQTADGRITLQDVAVETLDARTDDGRIEAHRLAVAGSAPHATLSTADGSIRVDGSFAPGGSYDVSTKDGSIKAQLAHDADLTVQASTADGRVLVDGSPGERADDDSARRSLTLGNGSGNLRLSSGDGSIHILTNGAV